MSGYWQQALPVANLLGLPLPTPFRFLHRLFFLPSSEFVMSRPTDQFIGFEWNMTRRTEQQFFYRSPKSFGKNEVVAVFGVT
ncbi:MAG: hypothetical protein EBU84_13625 [Actinobacteria bacterium]|nr:hypothetical protein [Actinomycetota bacterium]